ncbi:hypothetical protein MLD38_023921 [Melastoma candidum]|uniref:Uncharacterized protein n=1 Tax=Melastoma candidum TaxID=119954 RepID=A0ACB9NTM7_9MYRT|nr:hypothetical protein MLD38_023921 [Melastoma candidum]
MGACCSRDVADAKFVGGLVVDEALFEDDVDDVVYGKGDRGARIRLKGSSDRVSMFKQQGRKGVNQDAMTVWEDFTGEEDMFFCGVFDGHGPLGHRVARRVRDGLPKKLSMVIESSSRGIGSSDVEAEVGDKGDKQQTNADEFGREEMADGREEDYGENILLSSWEANYVRSFKEMDNELGEDTSIDSYCSGTTAVTIVKKGKHLIIANLGDSRAVLCKRGQNNQLVPIQLTVDLKPNVASEAERIRKCKGRVFAMDQEPEVYRVWMPDENCPGLAMARAFGDFCLKDYGLISVPEISYRMITPDDEFVILATDGIWDALSNDQVVRIVASAKRRSLAAKLLVAHATLAWKTRFPGCKIDDCAVVCLFLKDPPRARETPRASSGKKDVGQYRSLSNKSMKPRRDDLAGPVDSMVDKDSVIDKDQDEWDALGGVNRVNSLVNVPRLHPNLSRRKTVKEPEAVAVEGVH